MDKPRKILAGIVLGLLALLALGSATIAAPQSGGWLVEGNQIDAHLGQTVTWAGDVNGDGFGDLLVGGRFDFGSGMTGVAYAYYGSSTGLPSSPSWVAPNDQPDQYNFLAIAGAGDVNGDGFDDVIIGAGHHTNTLTEEGRASIFFGSPDGLSNTPAWMVDGNQYMIYFGTSVAGAGDVNGDGFDDVIVGAPYKRDSAGNVVGQVLLYLGAPGGPSTSPAWTVEGPGGWSSFAYRLNTAGDVNADGYADFMVSDYFYTADQKAEGRVFVFHGSPGGPVAAETFDGNQANSYFGAALAPAGDVNGDGFDDIIIGAHSYDNPESAEGRAVIYYGSASGLGPQIGWSAESNVAFSYFGNAVASAGDVNGDGYADVVIGAYGLTNEELGEGRAYLFLGSATGPGSNPAWTAEGDQEQANFGGAVGSAGDVDGDGRDEWVVGAPQYDRGETDEGIAVLFEDLGSTLPTPPPTTPAPTPTPITYVLHVSDLDGQSFNVKNTWTAQVTVEARGEDGNLVDFVKISGTWSTGTTGTCTQGVYGGCPISLSDLPKNLHSVTFTVTDLQRERATYDPSANTDPDGDSNGTTITVSR